MFTLLMIIGCVIGLIIFAAVIIGLMVVLQNGEQDPVSTAREGWIRRRSEQDQDGW